MQIQLKFLAEEMQAIIKGLEKVKQELAASENDGLVSEIFRKVMSGIIFLFYCIFDIPYISCIQSILWNEHRSISDVRSEMN